MKSMTGYGKAKRVKAGYEVTVELKSVNNRFLDINLRTPRHISFLDEPLRRGITKAVKRGTIDVFILFEDKSESGKNVEIDMALARAYVSAAKKLRTEFLLDDDFQLTALMRSPDVLSTQTLECDTKLVEQIAVEALTAALDELNKMRTSEGENLKTQLVSCVREIEKTVDAVAARAGAIIAEYREKLKARISEAISDVAIDEAKLLNEVAFYADRCDISEEITRLRSHLKQFYEILSDSGEQGRRLDFLLQEINREVNTIGSKSGDIEAASNVVRMKNEVEKLREQIRNIE